MPTLLAWPWSSLLSSNNFKFTTSTFVAGVGETYLTHSFPFSVNSLGGKMEFKKSSDLYYDDALTVASFDCELLLLGALVDTKIGVSYLTNDSNSLFLDIFEF